GGFDDRGGFNSERKASMIAGEDSLLALRIKESGYSIYYQPKAKVFHHISASKLSKKYFLKRHFWEGVTHMIIEECKGLNSPKQMRGHFIWHLMKIFKVSTKLFIMCLCLNGNMPMKMLNLSEVAYNLGICAESLRYL